MAKRIAVRSRPSSPLNPNSSMLASDSSPSNFGGGQGGAGSDQYYDDSPLSGQNPPNINPNPNSLPSGMVGVASTSGGGAGGEKKKRTRNRIPGSCATCRQKKLRCDRGYPCGSCAQKNLECKWDGESVPLMVQRDNEQFERLTEQVDKLSDLVTNLSQIVFSLSKTVAASAATTSTTVGTTTPTGSNTGGVVGISSPFIGVALPPAYHPGPHHPHDPHHHHHHHHHHSPNHPWLPGHLTAAPERQESEKINLASHDLLADELANLAVSQFSRAYRAEAVPSDMSLIQEARGVVEKTSNRNGGPSHSGPSSAHRSASVGPFPFGKPDTLPSILKLFPSTEQALAAVKQYLKVDWYLHPLHLPTFRDQWTSLYRSLSVGQEPDLFFLATFFAVCGMGLAKMPIDRAVRAGFPLEKDEVSMKWLEASTSVLALARFLDRPNLDALRAIILLNSYSVFVSNGEWSGKGMGLLSLGVQIAFQLELHRDPGNFTGKFSPLEAEDRRRIFWTLFSLDVFASSTLGRRWSLFDLKAIDTQLPKDLEDDEISTNGVQSPQGYSVNRTMPSLIARIKISIVGRKITEEAFGIKPCSYSQILKFDKELGDIEMELPEVYALGWDGVDVRHSPALPGEVEVMEMRKFMIHLELSSQRLRLHRPFLVTDMSQRDTTYSRNTCINSARIVLALHRHPVFNQFASAGILLRALTAAIALSIEVLQNPQSANVGRYKEEVQMARRMIELSADDSEIARKGAKVLEWLEEKRKPSASDLTGPQRQGTLTDGSPSGQSVAATPASAFAERHENHPKMSISEAFMSSVAPEDWQQAAQAVAGANPDGGSNGRGGGGGGGNDQLLNAATRHTIFDTPQSMPSDPFTFDIPAESLPPSSLIDTSGAIVPTDGVLTPGVSNTSASPAVAGNNDDFIFNIHPPSRKGTDGAAVFDLGTFGLSQQEWTKMFSDSNTTPSSMFPDPSAANSMFGFGGEPFRQE